MNVAYNQISCSDASRIIGVDYSSVTTWCRSGRINCTNISEGTTNGRYVIPEEEVDYIKTLKQKFGKQFIRKYRKDWQRGKQPAEPRIEEPAPIKEFRYTDTDSVITNTKTDIDDIANKIRTIQRIKTRLEDLDKERQQLSDKLEELRDEVMNYL